MLNGSCLCGDVAYRADADSSRIAHCHCRIGRKTDGAAFSSVAALPHEKFTWIRGVEQPVSFESSPGKFRRVCTRRGSHIMAERTVQPTILLRLGCHDTTVGGRPQVHVWRSEGLA